MVWAERDDAGIAPPSDTILTIDPAAFEHTVDVDLLGQWRTMRATFPHLVNSRGHILVVASIYALFNGAMNASYAASKAGTVMLNNSRLSAAIPRAETNKDPELRPRDLSTP